VTSSLELTSRLWQQVGGDPELPHGVRLSGPDQVLPSVFDVAALAVASVAAATVAAAQFLALRTGTRPAAVQVDRRAASAAFICERLFAPDGWQLPPIWDPIAGDYPTADGWIRLHTNYQHHRAAAQRVLGAAADRATIATEVRRWAATDLESAIVHAGGCAAALHDRSHWLASAAGAATAREPIAHLDLRSAPAPRDLAEVSPVRPYTGVRVLDLTRVIAGPTATRLLAGYGADVLRIDPRGFAEVPALIPETSAGKHCTALDLTRAADRAVFERLVTEAHVLVCGLRPQALAGLGYPPVVLRALNPALITASLDAYGWHGPWQHRRGFDSLVQMSTGIAAVGALARGVDQPVPLPAQALDHATGYLLAAALGSALSRLVADAQTSDIRVSLLGTANVLQDCPTPDGLDTPEPTWAPADTEPTSTAWGPARRVPLPGSIAGVAKNFAIDAGPLGRHPASWTTN
jgi:crotonobetainyl-CoA:carnitine CoA-transferase CaiB-like acyl-CoA transferase